MTPMQYFNVAVRVLIAILTALNETRGESQLRVSEVLSGAQRELPDLGSMHETSRGGA